MEQPETSLVVRAQRGDRIALAQLIRDTTPGIFRFTLRMTRSEEDARDLTQETFLRMMRSLDRYDAQYPFLTWLYRIARNLCIDRVRHKGRWKMAHASTEDEDQGDPMDDLADGKESQLDGLLTRETQSTIEKALEGLKPAYREVLVLFHFEDLSYQEIANVLQLPIGTVMTRIFRARQQLKGLLGETLLAT